MATKKKIKFLRDEDYDGRWVRAWKENRQDIAVQIWNNGKPEGEPDGDWAMPAVLGTESCIQQALAQTDK